MAALVNRRVLELFPEWEAFVQAVQASRPDAGTWCEGWTVRDILIHNTGNAEEFIRVLGGHLNGERVPSRGFEEREAEFRSMSDSDLWTAFLARSEQLVRTCDAADQSLPSDEVIIWTGREVTPAFFAEHMREEMVLHRWDVTGDDDVAVRSLMQPWMTSHTVWQVGQPLLTRGRKVLNLGSGEEILGRMRSPGTDDVLVKACAEGASLSLVSPEGDALIESDAAVRTLFLWGRRPANPSRWNSSAAPDALRRLRTLLSGY